MNYEKLRLREPGIEPTNELLAKTLGGSYKAYTAFQNGLVAVDIENVWQYYPCVGTKAWMARGVFKWTTPRGAKKEKNIFWMSAWDGYFKVAVWFKGPNRTEVLKLNISDKTKQLVTQAKVLGEKMNTFPVEFDIITTEPLADIYELIKCKKRLEA